MLPNRSSVSKYIEFSHIDMLEGPISRGNSPCNFFGFANLLGCEVAFQQCSGSCLSTNHFISAAGDRSKTPLAPTMNQQMVKFVTAKAVEIASAVEAKGINPHPSYGD
jgi:hypothetical protein